MRTDITRNDAYRGVYKREIWTFDFSGYYPERIYLDNYLLQQKDGKQRVYRTIKKWDRLDKRANTVENPPIPDDVVMEAKNNFADQIMKIGITL